MDIEQAAVELGAKKEPLGPEIAEVVGESRCQALKRSLYLHHRLTRYFSAIALFTICTLILIHRLAPSLPAQPPASSQHSTTPHDIAQAQDTIGNADNRLENTLLRQPHAYSSSWAPLVLQKCTPSMPEYYAPYIAERHTELNGSLYGEELIYPDFAIPFPIFAREEHRERWLAAQPAIMGRAIPMEQMADDTDWMVYKSQHGQNFVVLDVDFTPPASYDVWSEEACMSSPTFSGLALRSHNTSNASQGSNATAILVDSPDSWSFQHFIDRVTHVITQASHLYDSPPMALTGQSGNELVDSLWSKLEITKDRVKHYEMETLSLDKLYHSCKAVLIHPYLTWKSAELMKMPWANADKRADSSTKKKVFYMTRSNGKANNGGRRVLNEDQILSRVERLLVERDKGESLVIFDPDSYADVDDLIETLFRDALAIVGPHGGAMMNHRFAGPGTLVLEFLPTSWMIFENYEESSLMNQTYAAIVVEPEVGIQHDMRVSPEDVARVLGDHMGILREVGLRPIYDWPQE